MSLDIEQRFICALLRAPRNDQEKFYDRQLPLGLFKQREAEISWIARYRDKHSSYPSPAIFRSRFKWLVKPVVETVTQTLEAVVSQEQYRQIKRVVTQTRELMDSGTEMGDVASYFKNEAEQLSNYEVETEDINIAKSRGALIRYAKIKQMKTVKGGTLFVTPWPALNKVLKFNRPGELAVLMGRLGMGKTYYLLFWAVFLAELGHKVLFVSKEMSTEAIEDRIEIMRFGLDPEKFKDASFTKQEYGAWKRKKMKATPVEFILSGKETLTGTGFAEIYALVKKHSPQAVFVDAAYRIVLPGVPKNIQPVEYLTKIAQQSKRGARATNTFWAISIQMNRGAEDKKGGTKGGVVNAYGADAWGQEADVMLGIQGQRNSSDVRELEILKSRDSGAGTVIVNFKFSPTLNFKEASQSQINAGQPSTSFKGI